MAQDSASARTGSLVVGGGAMMNSLTWVELKACGWVLALLGTLGCGLATGVGIAAMGHGQQVAVAIGIAIAAVGLLFVGIRLIERH